MDRNIYGLTAKCNRQQEQIDSLINAIQELQRVVNKLLPREDDYRYDPFHEFDRHIFEAEYGPKSDYV